MKNTLYTFILLCLAFSGMNMHAQQRSNYSFYRQNMNLLNPAYAGADGKTSFMGLYRTNWRGVADASVSRAFSFGTPVGKQVGLGVSVENQEVFIERQTMVNLDFSYWLPLNESLDLFLGLKAGGNFYDVDAQRLQTWNYDSDASLVGLSRFNPNFGAGALLRHESFYISFSAPRILSSKRAKEDEGIVTTAADRPHFYLSGGYDVPLNGSLVFQPSMMLRYVEGAPVSAEFTALMQLHESFSLGAAYRTDKALSSLALLNVSHWLDFGYAYEAALRSNLLHVSNGSHELFLRFTLN